jgi:hypothetical protein
VSLWYPYCSVVPQQGAPTVGDSSAQDDQKKTSGNENDQTNASQVFRRGIIPPDGWDTPKEEVIPVPPLPSVTPLPLESDSNRKSPEISNLVVPPIFGGREEEVAHHAWRYLIASREPATGLYDSVIHYPATTIWDVGSSLAALVSAERLGLLSRTSFRLQMEQVLNSLAKIALYNKELPNREYNVRSLVMLDHHSAPSETGSGWSALDIGRVLIWLKIVSIWYPDMKPLCDRIVGRWDFSRLRLNGEANGTSVDNGKENIRQEGRLGYEQYAAKGFGLWGVELSKASGYSHAEPMKILNVELRQDNRGYSFLTGEPFFLARMEIGPIDPLFDELSSAIFEVERLRWKETGILTAVSEDSVSLEPWFVYNTILYNGQPWECVSTTGKALPALKSLSTKAAFAYAALHNDVYGQRLEKVAESLLDPLYGYYAGEYEKGGVNRSLNLNTNAVVLEAMLYLKLGRRPFLQAAVPPIGITAANDAAQ